MRADAWVGSGIRVLAALGDCHGPSANVNPASLPISPSLVQALDAWSEAHERTLNQTYPLLSGFPDASTADAWLRAGAELAARLQEELADQRYGVEYAHASDEPSRLVAARGWDTAQPPL